MYFGRFEHGMMGGGLRLLFCVFGFLVFIAVITVVVLLVVKLLGHKSHLGLHSGNNVPGNYSIYVGKALEILNERYAKGEVDDEEYARKKAELTKH
jgi:putative membrane protein